MATVSFRTKDGVKSFKAKKSKASKPKTARKASKPSASKACGCAGTTTTRKNTALALTRVENLKNFAVSNVQTLRREMGEVKGRLGKVETRVGEHEAAIASLAMRASRMFGAGTAESMRPMKGDVVLKPPPGWEPVGGIEDAPPRSSRFGAGSPEPGRPRPAPPPMIPRGSAMPNRQMGLFN